MIIDAYSHVCPEGLLNAIEELNPTAEAAALRPRDVPIWIHPQHGHSYPWLKQPLAGRPSDYLRKFCNDSMVNGSASAMRCGLDFFGAAQVMYGTDFPMRPHDGEDGPKEVLDTVRSIGLDQADLDNLLGGNLHRLIRL